MTETSTASEGTSGEASDIRLRQFLGYTMKRAYMRIQEDMSETLEPFGLRLGTFSALAVVVGNPGMSQTQLSRVLNIKRSGVVVVVDELERAGALERAPVAGDRRVYSLRVTAAGNRLWQKVEKAVLSHEQRLFSELDDHEIRKLHELLERAALSAARNTQEKAN